LIATKFMVGRCTASAIASANRHGGLLGLSSYRPPVGGAWSRRAHAMRTSHKTLEPIATIGVDLGNNTFHLVGLDKRGAIVLQQKVSRGQIERRLANIPRFLAP
jgi:hypothetical protein